MKEPVPSAAAVAAEIRQRQSVAIMQLHKLLYYVQGYHLAWEGCPAFAECIEARERGPVVADLWRNEEHGNSVPVSGQLPESVRNTVTYVLRRYGQLTGKALSEATHAEAPWQSSRYNEEISHSRLIGHFSQETPEMQRMKRALARVRDDSPFVPDPPGALDAIMSEYSPT